MVVSHQVLCKNKCSQPLSPLCSPWKITSNFPELRKESVPISLICRSAHKLEAEPISMLYPQALAQCPSVVSAGLQVLRFVRVSQFYKIGEMFDRGGSVGLNG